MSLQGTPLGSQHVSINGGASQPSAKKLRVQNSDAREPSPPDSEQYTDNSRTAQQQSQGAQSQDGVEGEEGPQLTTDPESMTDTVRAGIYMMQTRKKAVETQVECLTCDYHTSLTPVTRN